MPEASGVRPQSADGFVMNVAADRPDLRDKVYSPSLRRLPAQYLPDHADIRLPVVRNQGSEGACTAMALANVIDIQRLAEDPRASPVSPRMLFEMAKGQQRSASGEEPQFYSLRPVIKSFYHNGVCLESDWPYVAGQEDAEVSVARARAARNIILGAYFRVAAYLDDYHAALHETGALLVAAHVHANWERANVARNGGRILPAVSGGEGAHAFALVGYDSEGFLVVNSWGEEWGGFGDRPGVAHWRYEDWADSIIDAWVLRLAVSTPGAFECTLGENGLAVGSASIRHASVRRATLMGHYIHLDDGRHVDVGAYPSSRDMVDETVRFLASRAGTADGAAEVSPAPEPPAERPRQYRDVLVRFVSSSESLDSMVRTAAHALSYWKSRGIYPFWVFWCNDHALQCRGALNAIIEAAQAQVGETGRALDMLIEQGVRGLGRAVWRDVKESARRAMASDGDGYHLVRSFAAVCAEHRLRLHLLSESEGVFPLMECVSRAMQDAVGRDALVASLATLTLLAPTCTRDAFRTAIAPLLRRSEAARPAIAVHGPSREFEARMRVGAYGGSYFRLVANAFEDRGRDGRPQLLIGAPFMGAPFMGAPATGTPSTGAPVMGAPVSRARRNSVLPGVPFIACDPPDHSVSPLELSHLIDEASARRAFGNTVHFIMQNEKAHLSKRQ